MKSIPKTGISSNGKPMHLSVGAIIRDDAGCYLLIDRAVMPFGFAGVGGHVDEGESPEQAIVREVAEEAVLKVDEMKLLFEEKRENNECSKGLAVHYWYLFECRVSGAMKRNERETKSAGWYTAEEIKQLTLEPIWDYCLRKAKVI